MRPVVVRKNGKNINNVKLDKKQEKNNVGGAAYSDPQNRNNTQKKSSPNTTNLSYWNNVIDKIKQSGKMGIYVNLIGSTAKEVNDMIIEVKLTNRNSFAKQILEAHDNKAEIEKIVSIEAGKTMNVRFVSEEEQSKTNTAANPIENIANDLDIPFNVIDE